MAPNPTTTAMKPNASPNPLWIDFNTLSGGMPTANPSAMLETNRAKKACSFKAMIRVSRRAIATTVMRIRYGPFAGIEYMHCTGLGFGARQAITIGFLSKGESL